MSSEPEPTRAIFLRHMRIPIFAFAALLVMLAVIVTLGAVIPSRTASFIECGVLVCMVLTVLLFSMEVPSEPPLIRFFAGLGFVWVAVLFGVTMLDYVTR
jgi:cytochrome c oxidase subunit 4